MSSRLRSTSISCSSVSRSPSRPQVSRQVCRPSSLQRRSTRVVKRVCNTGSPPESVMPPLLSFSACAYLPITFIVWSTLYGLPFWRCQVSGLWQYWHRIRRSEEHTSELQSQFHLVCRLLL